MACRGSLTSQVELFVWKATVQTCLIFITRPSPQVENDLKRILSPEMSVETDSFKLISMFADVWRFFTFLCAFDVVEVQEPFKKLPEGGTLLLDRLWARRDAWVPESDAFFLIFLYFPYS